MAINPETQYPGKIAPSSPQYPFGQARNITLPGDGTGTPWEAALVNDLLGFQQALLDSVGAVPTGTPDEVGASQYFEALLVNIGNNANAGYLLSQVTADPKLVAGQTRRITDRGDALFDVITKGTTPGVDLPDEFSIITCTGVATLALRLRIVGNVFNVVDFGAVGDDSTDDFPPIQATLTAAADYVAANVNSGAEVLLPPLPYFISETLGLSTTGQTITERYTENQAGNPVPDISDVKIRGYGAKLRCVSSTFTPTFPFCMLVLCYAQRSSVRGVFFESDLNNKLANWFDSTNYFNKGVPAVKGEYGLVAIRCSDFKFQDNILKHLEVGLTITDDRNGAHTFPDDMEAYRTEVSGNRFFNIWTGMSMSNGSNEEWLIHHNHIQYTFIKLANASDQGRGIQFTNNTCRDISGILLLASDMIVSGNTFNNFLGGFSLNPQGDGQLVYNYEMRNMCINDNIANSDHMTEVDGEAIGAGTARPQAWVTFNSTIVGTGGQETAVIDFESSDNKVNLWPQPGNSTGAFLLRTGDGDIVFKRGKSNGNVAVLNNNLGVIVAMAPVAAFSATRFEGTFQFKDNNFERTISGAAGFDFQFMAGTFGIDAVLDVSGTTARTLSDNVQCVVGNFSKLIAKDTHFLSEEGFAAMATFWTRSVPKVELQNVEHTKFNTVGNTGEILKFDGITSTVYDTILDSAIVRIKDCRVTSALYIFKPEFVTFPASSKGLYEFDSSTIRNSATPSNNVYATNASFVNENVVNPSKSTPLALDVPLPSGYIVWNYKNTGQIGWQFNGSWINLAAFGAT